VIARRWQGWTTKQNADAYEALLRTTVLPGIHRVRGYRGAYLLRRDAGDEVAFVTITLFDSMDAVRAFAAADRGTDYERAVIEPEARKLLARFDERAVHYEVVYEPRPQIESRHREGKEQPQINAD
jgi:heme-degrading monooxygenase HmoA